jgi:hypothetical protein
MYTIYAGVFIYLCEIEYCIAVGSVEQQFGRAAPKTDVSRSQLDFGLSSSGSVTLTLGRFDSKVLRDA